MRTHHLKRFSKGRQRIALFGALVVVAPLLLASAQRPPVEMLQWLSVDPEFDSREAESADFDFAMDQQLVAAINSADEFPAKLEIARAGLSRLEKISPAFASLHYDPVRPGRLTEEEKRALERYLSRGGFLLLVENNYAYRQNEFRRKVPSPVFLFLAKELPSRNRDFRSSTADLDHPIFHQYFDITYPPAIARERKQNPYYRGETIFVFKNNLVGYTLALFAFDDGDKFVPLRKPYQVYALWPEGYRLIINAYLYGLAH